MAVDPVWRAPRTVADVTDQEWQDYGHYVFLILHSPLGTADPDAEALERGLSAGSFPGWGLSVGGRPIAWRAYLDHCRTAGVVPEASGPHGGRCVCRGPEVRGHSWPREFQWAPGACTTDARGGRKEG